MEPTVVRLTGRVSIYDVGRLQQEILTAFSGNTVLHLDATGVTDCDTAVVQLLASCFHEAVARGIRLDFCLSPALSSCAAGIGVDFSEMAAAMGGDIHAEIRSGGR